jgi:hypothetical protein
MGRNPLGLVEAPAPMAFRLAGLQELRPPPFQSDARPQIGALFIQEIAVNLVLDGDIACQQPVQEVISNRRHGSSAAMIGSTRGTHRNAQLSEVDA